MTPIGFSSTPEPIDRPNLGLLRQYERAYGPFTHMSQQEKAVWLRWLMRGGTQYAPFTYDIRVGDGLPMPPGSTGYDIRSAYALTTKRIDALYKIGNATVIVEVKQRAGASAVGQLLTYRDLYRQTPGHSGDVLMLLVCESLQPDMTAVLDQQGISWATV